MKINKALIAGILGVVLVFNTFLIANLTDKVSDLENRLDYMNSDISSGISRAESAVFNLQSELISRIEKGESLLSYSDSKVGYLDGNINISIKAVPKEIASDEKVFIAIGENKKSATTQNGSEYTADFIVEMPTKVVPTIIFESSGSTRQETLPEIDVNRTLILNYECIWGDPYWENEGEVQVDQENMFTIIFYKENRQFAEIIDEIETVKLIVIDPVSDREIGSKFMEKTDSTSEYFLKELSPSAYNLDMEEFYKNQGTFEIWVEVTTDSGLRYKDGVASFQRDTSTSFSEGGQGYLNPVWD
ncbi:hypothetical protein [Alkalibacter mobilis]|uniref:hypothetical protein n=1 Tax=Alkalibacter mobilis TaxID=2787712 RepID=UPI00189F6BF2|nr:hypothetical protein [Alkalibacter mobilis]MBF7097013.1 hypothetical protein [Alkalibacter mobilis]